MNSRLDCRDGPSASQEIGTWIQRLHVLVIGPGLGRDQQILATTKVTAATVHCNIVKAS